MITKQYTDFIESLNQKDIEILNFLKGGTKNENLWTNN